MSRSFPNQNIEKDQPKYSAFLDEKETAAVVSIKEVLMSPAVLVLSESNGLYTPKPKACDK